MSWILVLFVHAGMMSDKDSMAIATQVATKELQRQTLKGRLFFNEKKYKKRFDTPHKPIVSGDLIFY